MSAKIIVLPVTTKCDITPERVLQAAIDADLQGVVVLGFTKDDQEYMASSIASGPEVTWLLERCKQQLLRYDGND